MRDPQPVVGLVGEPSTWPNQPNTDYASAVRLGLWLLGLGMGGFPVLVVLDEPNAHLDEADDTAWLQTPHRMHEDGRTVVVVTHRANLLTAAEMVLPPDVSAGAPGKEVA